MLEISKRAQEVLEHRKESLREAEEKRKQKEEREKKEFEEFINLILNVFEASDEEQKETEEKVLVWKITIKRIAIRRLENEDEVRSKVHCGVNFNPNINEGTYYFDSHVFLKDNKKILSAMETVQSIEISVRTFNNVYDYFANVPGYKVEQIGDTITITMLKS